MTGSAAKDEEVWPTPADRRNSLAMTRALRDQAAAGGLRFEAYLPPALAVWLLDRIEKGDFVDPSEATFVLLGEAMELEPHEDLRKEVLRRSLDRAAEGETVPAEKAMRMLQEKFSRPRPEPARWKNGAGREDDPAVG